MMFPPDFPIDAYFKHLQLCKHVNIWKAKGLSADVKNKYISFEIPDLTVEAYLNVRKRHLYTPRGPCSFTANVYNSSLFPTYGYAARDFTRPMREIIRGLVKGIASLHRKGMYHGELHIKNIYIVLNGDIESEFLCVKLMMPEFQGEDWHRKNEISPFSMESDWNELGRLVKVIVSKEGMILSERAEIKDLYDRLIQCDLIGENDILSHPSLIHFDARKLVLLDFVDTMAPNTRYLGSTFNYFWVSHFKAILDVLAVGPKVRTHCVNGYKPFLHLARNICCAHFGSLSSSLQATLIDDDTALRRLRGYYPLIIFGVG